MVGRAGYLGESRRVAEQMDDRGGTERVLEWCSCNCQVGIVGVDESKKSNECGWPARLLCMHSQFLFRCASCFAPSRPQNRYPGTLRQPEAAEQWRAAQACSGGLGALESHCGPLAAQIQRGVSSGRYQQGPAETAAAAAKSIDRGRVCAVGVCPARATRKAVQMHEGGFFSGRRQRLRWGGRLWVTRGGLVTGQLVAVTEDLGLSNRVARCRSEIPTDTCRSAADPMARLLVRKYSAVTGAYVP